MHEQKFALRIIARLNSPKTPYTLPEPTVDQVVRWLASLCIPYRLGVIDRMLTHDPQNRAHYLQERPHWQQRLDFAHRLHEDGAITDEQLAFITAHRNPDTDPNVKAMREESKRWRPAWAINMRGREGEIVPVYQFIEASGQPVDLTYSGGQWYRY